MRLHRAQTRFHELTVKEALGHITSAETQKLNRYQRLLNCEKTPSIYSGQSDWTLRQLRKKFGAAMYRARTEGVKFHDAC